MPTEIEKRIMREQRMTILAALHTVARTCEPKSHFVFLGEILDACLQLIGGIYNARGKDLEQIMDDLYALAKEHAQKMIIEIDQDVLRDTPPKGNG